MSRNFDAGVFLACGVVALLLCGRVEGGSITLAWDPSPSSSVAGYSLYYGLVSGTYTAKLDPCTNCIVTVDGLDCGATYFFTVTAYDDRGVESTNSNELGVTIPFPPLILFGPSSQTAQAGATVTLYVDAVGAPPLTFQWFNGGAPISGGTNSLLTLPQVADTNAGDYNVIITDWGGSVTSAVAVVTVIDSASPLTAISGDLGTLLRSAAGPTNNKLLAVLSAPNLIAPIASAAGTYSGLFYPTNDWGMPEITLQTAGILSDCVVDSQGDYTGAIYIAGLSNSIAGIFDAAGNGSATIDRAAAGLSDLGVVLHLSLTTGALQMTGMVSNLDQANPWTAVLYADTATNQFAQSPDFVLVIPPVNGFSSGSVTGIVGDVVITLFGMLGDGTTFVQNAPVSSDGTLPLFIQLNGQAGLLAGWVNVFATPPTSLLTWISPPGLLGPGFTSVVEATVTPSSATTP